MLGSLGQLNLVQLQPLLVVLVVVLDLSLLLGGNLLGEGVPVHAMHLEKTSTVTTVAPSSYECDK